MNQLEIRDGLKATIKTNRGDMIFVLFPDVAPRAVENFSTHAKAGYYDGLIFHRVIKDFMIQGGDPVGNGTGGQSIWGAPFEDEFSTDAHNFYGALSMANSGPHTNGSQFFIVQAKTAPQQMLDEMEELTDKGYPRECIDGYKAVGGTPWLDYHHTVFGQLIEGKDVLEDIANVKTGANDKPLYDVVIEKIEIA